MAQIAKARRTVGLLLLLSIAPGVLCSQVVTGRVVDTGGRPVAFVHVVATDSANGAVGVGTLTDSVGRFRLRLAGLKPAYLAFRRLGFRGEAPQHLDWTSSDTIQLDVVLRALPYVLPSVLVTGNECTELGSPDSPADLRELWEMSTSAMGAREAFAAEFSYQMHSTGHRSLNGKVIAEDTTVTVRPPLPPLDRSQISAPLISYREGNLLRKGHLSFSTVDVRVLLQPAFVNQYCVVSLAPTDSAGEALLTMRERQPANPLATVLWTMHFVQGFPGPTRVTFEYSVRGHLVSRAEHRYASFDVGGFRFPLTSESSMSAMDSRSGNSLGDAREQFSYFGFVRVPVNPGGR